MASVGFSLSSAMNAGPPAPLVHADDVARAARLRAFGAVGAASAASGAANHIPSAITVANLPPERHMAMPVSAVGTGVGIEASVPVMVPPHYEASAPLVVEDEDSNVRSPPKSNGFSLSSSNMSASGGSSRSANYHVLSDADGEQ
jgi:hypothetical protein